MLPAAATRPHPTPPQPPPKSVRSKLRTYNSDRQAAAKPAATRKIPCWIPDNRAGSIMAIAHTLRRMSSSRLRIGRHSTPGAFYSVTVIVNRRVDLFSNSALARLVTDALHAATSPGLAWVVMPDHVHWLLQLRDVDLTQEIQTFKSRAARAINSARGMSGAIWQSGFYDHRIRGNEDLRRQARYVVANPVRRGLVERIEDYPHWWCPWVTCTEDLWI